MNTIIPICQTSTIATLLLNAWSAEYALRIKLLDEQSKAQPVAWTCPQAYFAFLFSVRAVLAVDGIQLANPTKIETQIKRWVRSGRYGRGFTATNNPLIELLLFRPGAQLKPPCLLPAQISQLHNKLIAKIQAFSIIHETYILDRLGNESYKNIINDLPDHLKYGFVGARATLLLQDD